MSGHPRPARTRTAAFCDLGLTPYAKVHELQLDLVSRRRRNSLARDLFLCVEHPPVFTLGRGGNRAHVGVSEMFLRERGIDVVAIERGGEVTYHGPGQLVLYPIVDLRLCRLSVSAYIRMLEELMLCLAGDCGVAANRDSRNHGVWVGDTKLGSVGIAVRHGVAFHGMALNVDLDLAPFAWINPCGLAGISMTSLAHAGGSGCSLDRLKVRLQRHLADLFAVDLHPVHRSRLEADCPAIQGHP